jgi:adenosylcobinamide-GDP ribazoletransferase
MKNLISTIQFITILPIGKPGTFEPGKMVSFFPIVGLLVGGVVAILDQAALHLWSRPVAALIDVIVLAALTGAFHLDGLGDAADGLFSHRSRDEAMAIMKDSRIGTMGLVAIVCALAVKWGGILGLDSKRSLLLILVPAYARGGMLFGIRLLDYGRPEGGTGQDFFKEKLSLSNFWGLLFPIVLSIFLGWQAVALNLEFVALVTGILLYYKKRMGCITGDMLGAMTEVTESALFLLISI